MSTLIEREAAPNRLNGTDPELKTAPDRAPLLKSEPVKSPEETAPSGEEAEAQDAEQQGQAEDPKPGRKGFSPIKAILLASSLAGLVAGGAWGARTWSYASAHVSTDDAYVTTDVVQITPQVSGNMARVLVTDNQPVKKGQLLAVIDDSTFKADVDQAQANLQVAEAAAQGASSTVNLTEQTGSAQVTQAQGGVAEAQSGIGAAEAEVDRMKAGITNAQASVASSQANVANAQAAVNAAIASKSHAEQAVKAAQAAIEVAQTGVRSAEAGVEAAKANAERATKDEKRYALLLSYGAVSAQSAEAERASGRTARAQLTSAQEGVSQAQSVLEQRKADLAASQDAVAAAEAQVQQARAGVTAQQEAVHSAEASVEQAQAMWASAVKNVGQAQAKRKQAVGTLAQAQTAPHQVQVSTANLRTAQAKVSQARAALENARIALGRTRIVAPVDGYITRKTAQIGQQVAPGQSLMALIPSNDLWIVANYKETQLKGVHPGQKAEMEVDTFPGRTFEGVVDSIAPNTGAAVALLPPDNASGNFTKVVQRVPVKVLLTPGQKGLEQLRGGLSVVVNIRTRGGE